jgi:hypothetical protein
VTSNGTEKVDPKRFANEVICTTEVSVLDPVDNFRSAHSCGAEFGAPKTVRASQCSCAPGISAAAILPCMHRLQADLNFGLNRANEISIFTIRPEI